MRDHKIPAFIKMLQYIIFDMGTGLLSWEEITGPCIVAPGKECIPYRPGELARYQYFQTSVIRVIKGRLLPHMPVCVLDI